jgi:hypothetical protein
VRERLRIDILYFEGCLHVRATLALVQQVVFDLGVDSDVSLVEIVDQEAAVDLRFLGSPTVLVDGRDVEPGVAERSDYVFASRIYRTENGLAPGPTEEWIRAALTA